MPCWGDWGAGDDVDWASVPLHTIDALPEAYRGATCYVLRSSTKYAMAEGILLQIESHGWRWRCCHEYEVPRLTPHRPW